jgi:hypothetical protein
VALILYVSAAKGDLAGAEHLLTPRPIFQKALIAPFLTANPLKHTPFNGTKRLTCGKPFFRRAAVPSRSMWCCELLTSSACQRTSAGSRNPQPPFANGNNYTTNYVRQAACSGGGSRDSSLANDALKISFTEKLSMLFRRFDYP